MGPVMISWWEILKFAVTVVISPLVLWVLNQNKASKENGEAVKLAAVRLENKVDAVDTKVDQVKDQMWRLDTTVNAHGTQLSSLDKEVAVIKVLLSPSSPPKQ